MPVGLSDWLDGTKLREEFTEENRITRQVARALACLDERREFRECLPPAGLVVGGRHAGR